MSTPPLRGVTSMAKRPAKGRAELLADAERSRAEAVAAGDARRVRLADIQIAALRGDSRPAPQPARESVPPAPAPVSAEKEIVEKVRKRKIVAPNSKKHVVPKLPADWREQMWAAAAAPGKGRAKNGKTPKLREALAVQWITGCRPSEIALGVNVRKENGNLILTIFGSKVGEVKVQKKGPKKGEPVQVQEMGTAMRGIEYRILTVDPNLNDGTRYLLDQIEKSGGNNIVVQYKAAGFRSKLNGVGEAVTKGKRAKPIATTISPYCYRHATGADLKSCDTISDQAASAVMGHRSQASLERYGQRRRGGGGARPVIAVAVKPGQEPHGQRSHGPASADAPAEVARPGQG